MSYIYEGLGCCSGCLGRCQKRKFPEQVSTMRRKGGTWPSRGTYFYQGPEQFCALVIGQGTRSMTAQWHSIMQKQQYLKAFSTPGPQPPRMLLPLPSNEINLRALILHPLVILKAINEIILESPGKVLPGGSKSRKYYLPYALLLPMKSAAIRQIPAPKSPIFASHSSCNIRSLNYISLQTLWAFLQYLLLRQAVTSTECNEETVS